MANLTFNGSRILFPGGGILNYIPQPGTTPVSIPYVKWLPDEDWITFEDNGDLEITAAQASDLDFADANAADVGDSPFWNYNGQLTIEFNVSSYSLIADDNPWINVYYGSGSASLQSQEITGTGTYTFDLGNDDHDVNIFLSNGDLNAIPIASEFSMTSSFSAYTTA